MRWRSAVKDFPAGSTWVDLIRYPYPTAGREATCRRKKEGGKRKRSRRAGKSKRDWENGVLIDLEPLAIDGCRTRTQKCVWVRWGLQWILHLISPLIFLIPRFHYPCLTISPSLFIYFDWETWYFIYPIEIATLKTYNIL